MSIFASDPITLTSPPVTIPYLDYPPKPPKRTRRKGRGHLVRLVFAFTLVVVVLWLTYVMGWKSTLLFWSGEVVKYVLVAEAYFLIRSYLTATRPNKQICESCQERRTKKKGSNRKATRNNSTSVGTEAKISTTEAGTSTPVKLPTTSIFDFAKANGHDSSQRPASPRSTENIHRGLFFPDTSLVVPSVKAEGGFNVIITQDGQYPYSYEYLRDQPTEGPLQELMTYLMSAKKSVDICIYVLTFPPFADILISLHERNVQVRVIIDGREDEALRSQIPKLQRRGVLVKSNEKSYSILMHNKFVIIDGRILINGSLNWTKSAILLNYDNVLVTTQASLVDQYQKQFNLLWDKMKLYQEGLRKFGQKN